MQVSEVGGGACKAADRVRMLAAHAGHSRARMCQTVRGEAEELMKLVVEWPPLCAKRDMMMIMMRESWIILMKSARV